MGSMAKAFELLALFCGVGFMSSFILEGNSVGPLLPEKPTRDSVTLSRAVERFGCAQLRQRKTQISKSKSLTHVQLTMTFT